MNWEKIMNQEFIKLKESKGFPNRGDMILNVPIGLIWTEIFDICCQLSSVRFAI